MADVVSNPQVLQDAQMVFLIVDYLEKLHKRLPHDKVAEAAQMLTEAFKVSTGTTRRMRCGGQR